MSALIDCPVYLTESYTHRCICGRHRQNRRIRTRALEWSGALGGRYFTAEAAYLNGQLLTLSDVWFGNARYKLCRLATWSNA